MLKKILVSALCGLAFTTSVGAATGPFGLDWGVTPDDVKSEGVITTPHKTSTHIEVHGASHLPLGHSYGKAYSLMFDADFGLQRVTLISDTIEADADGSEGRIQYALLKQTLIDQYGEPIASAESVGDAFQLLPHEFYPCIAISDCGSWRAQFNDLDGTGQIVLEMHGIATGTGYITVTHEGPLWMPSSNQHVAGVH